MASFTLNAIKQIRKFHGMSQQQFGESLDISGSYVSMMESGKAKIPEDIGNKICRLYDVNYEWLCKGEGKPFSDETKSKQLLLQMSRPQNQKMLIAASAALAPIMPLATVGLSLGVTADYVLNKIQKVYGLNLGDLASEKLDVDRSTLNRWLKKNKIPQKIIEKVAEDTKINKEYFITNDQNLDVFISNIVEFTVAQIIKYKDSKIDKEEIKNDLIYCLDSNFDSVSTVDEVD